MTRILPERTVEAWTTAYLVRWFPTALVWAPTQGDVLNWDAAVGLPNFRYFVFEYKGVEGGKYPAIQIDVPQLRTYADLNQTVGRTVVWYLLPCWRGPAVAGSFLPNAARWRTLRAGDPRPAAKPPSPDRVTSQIPADRHEYVLGRGCESYFYLADPAQLLASGAFKAAAEQSRLRVERVPAAARGLTLEHFLHLVDADEAGVSWQTLMEHIESPERELIGPTRGRFATAFAVPTGGDYD